MRIALAQTYIEWENKAANLKMMRQIVLEAKENNTDILLFPEMSFTGFSMNTQITADHDQETKQAVADLARVHRLCIGFGWVKTQGIKCENLYTIVDDRGETVVEYSKIHPFSYSGEDRFFTAGDSICLFELGNIRMTVCLCYDLRFPEVFRKIGRQVEAVILPANWPMERRDHWNTLLRARAIENQVYVFAVNCVGDIGGKHYSGDSCVIDPLGRVLEELDGKQGILYYDLEGDTQHYRSEFPVLDDIRDENELMIKEM